MQEIEVVYLDKKPETQLILGHAGFIKTVEDLYEAMVNSVPGVKFGIAFAEASGPCLIRSDGNDEELKKQAEENMQKISAGHTFIVLFTNAFPINVVNAIKHVNEVARIYCATANPTQAIVMATDQGRGIIGIVDGSASRGLEGGEEREKRRKFLRDIGYKR